MKTNRDSNIYKSFGKGIIILSRFLQINFCTDVLTYNSRQRIEGLFIGSCYKQWPTTTERRSNFRSRLLSIIKFV